MIGTYFAMEQHLYRMMFDASDIFSSLNAQNSYIRMPEVVLTEKRKTIGKYTKLRIIPDLRK